MKPSKIILTAIYSVITMFIASAGGIINPFLIGAYFIAFIILHIIEDDNTLLLLTLPFVIIPVISGLIAYRVTTTCSTRRKLIISFSFLFGLKPGKYSIILTPS